MGKKEYAITKEEAQNELDYYKKVFDVVRILKADEVAGNCPKDCFDGKGNPCYSFFGKSKPCENCISACVLRSKKDKAKLEFSQEDVYQVISRYVEIDGEPCVRELLHKFDFDSLFDFATEKNLFHQLNDYYEKTYTDVLTGAYNRRYYEEKIKNSVLNGGIARIDLDDFKVYNDVYGHRAGDTVLNQFATELSKSIRSSDKLIRYGGDEFLLVRPGRHNDTFRPILTRILKRIDNLVLPDYQEINLTSSIGATICTNERVEEAVSRADHLLYKAKSKKDTIVTDTEEKISVSQNKLNILIVDDAKINRTILTTILSNEYNVIEADGGQACIDALQKYGNKISLILLDILRPQVNGFDVLKFRNWHHYIDDIPVITITGDESEETIRKAYEMGVSDFINRPFDARVVYKRVSNTITLYEKQRRLISSVSSETREKEKSSHILIDILGQVTEFGAGVGREHITNINRITELLLLQLRRKTKKYKLTKDDIFLISTASALHDIGKVEIDKSILNKPGKLTKEEFEKVKRHTVYGANIIKNIHKYKDEPLVKYAYEICLCHHEKYDGKGYPNGLKGDEIPISAQVVSLADCYDALTSKRVYKDAYPSDKAIERIQNGECGQFNPLLIECLLEIKDLIVKDENGEVK